MNNKYITTEQIKTILQNAPPQVDKAELLRQFDSNGYKIQGYNDQPEPEKPTTPEKVASFTGGKKIAQGLGQAAANTDNIMGTSTAMGNLKQPGDTGLAAGIDESQKNQFELQGKLIEAIKANKTAGKDTSRLENALKLLSEDVQNTADTAGEVLNQKGLTGKQVAGDALQLGTTVIGAGELPGVAKAATQANTVGKGIMQGARAGATGGAAYGAATGVAQGLQEDKNATDIAKSGISGGMTGAITGGVLGGVLGGVSGAVKANKLAKQEKYLDAITPDVKDLTPTEYKDLVSKEKIAPKTGAMTADKYILSEEEKLIARKYKDILTNDPVKNTTNIVNEIAKKDKEVGSFLKKNNGIFNTGELKNSLLKKLENVDDLTVDEKRLKKLKTTTIDNFVKSLDKNDMESLWTARKEFDRQIEKAFSGSPTLSNTIKKEFRNGIQDFIAERTPDGTYKASMKEMSQLFNLKDVTLTKAAKEKGMNALQLWIKRNPTKAKAIGWTAGTGLLGTLGASALNN